MSKFLVVGGKKTQIQIKVAKTLPERLIGLSMKEENLVDEGLYIPFCKEIQMQSCHIPLDVIFTDLKGIVRNTYGNVLPNSPNKGSWKGWNCFELPVGTITKFKIGNGTVLELADE